MTGARAIALVAGLGALALASGISLAAAARPAACPAGDRQAVVSVRPGAARELVPPGATRLLLCRYGGLNDGGAAFRLEAAPALVTRSATVARYARELDALQPTTGVYHCPSDTGKAIVVYFRYPTGPADPVTVGLDGCMLVNNGHLHRTAGVQAAGRSLVAAFKALVP